MSASSIQACEHSLSLKESGISVADLHKPSPQPQGSFSSVFLASADVGSCERWKSPMEEKGGSASAGKTKGQEAKGQGTGTGNSMSVRAFWDSITVCLSSFSVGYCFRHRTVGWGEFGPNHAGMLVGQRRREGPGDVLG